MKKNDGEYLKHQPHSIYQRHPHCHPANNRYPDKKPHRIICFVVFVWQWNNQTQISKNSHNGKKNVMPIIQKNNQRKTKNKQGNHKNYQGFFWCFCWYSCCSCKILLSCSSIVFSLFRLKPLQNLFLHIINVNVIGWDNPTHHLPDRAKYS